MTTETTTPADSPAQRPPADRPSVAAGSPPAPGEGDGQDTTPPNAQEAAEATARLIDEVLALEGAWAARATIAAAVLREYADRHHAHPGGPTNLIQTLTIREAGGAILDYDACRSCSARLDEFGQCAGERERLLLAAQRIAAGETDPADPPRPGTGWTPEPIAGEADRG